LHPIWRFLTDFGDTAVTAPLAVAMGVFLLAARQPRLAVGWGLAIVGCAGAIAGLKIALVVCGGYPFGGSGLRSPSGHSAMSIAVYGGIAAIVGATLKRRAREAVIAGGVVLGIAIALSRVILGYHTPIEVAVGLAVGSSALAIIVAIVARQRPGRLPVGWLVAAVLVVFALFHGTRWPAEQAIHRIARWFDALRPWCG
jgi:membrane-associated phospholipid phosphatase